MSRKGHIGSVVLGAVASGLGLGLLLTLGVFGGDGESRITGGALVALGAGFLLLDAGSRRLTDQPQRWAFVPGVASGLVGLGVLAVAPGGRELTLAGWVWPPLLALVAAWSYVGARRSLESWSRRALLNPALLVLLLAAIGGVFETVAEATTSNRPPTGLTYLVDGHQLYLNCTGSGAPTVVLFNGSGERAPSWARVQRGVSSMTRVCSFDSAGQGWSGGRSGQDGHQLAADVHALLGTAGVPGPYVVAGHSVGGPYALVYAADFPAETAGVALIDSASPRQFELPDYPGFYSMWRRVSALGPTLARAGIGRLVLDASPREIRADNAEFAVLPKVFEQAKTLQSLDGRPLAVLSASVGEQRGWAASQERLAQLSRNSVHREVPGATHEALLADARFASVTAHAIAEVVRFARTGRR